MLAKVPSNVTKEEAIRTMKIGITTGEERFNEAQVLIRAGKTKEAIRLLSNSARNARRPGSTGPAATKYEHCASSPTAHRQQTSERLNSLTRSKTKRLFTPTAHSW